MLGATSRAPLISAGAHSVDYGLTRASCTTPSAAVCLTNPTRSLYAHPHLTTGKWCAVAQHVVRMGRRGSRTL